MTWSSYYTDHEKKCLYLSYQQQIHFLFQPQLEANKGF